MQLPDVAEHHVPQLDVLEVVPATFIPPVQIGGIARRWAYNNVRPHNSLGYRPPAPEALVPWTSDFGASLLGRTSMAKAVASLS